MPDVRIRGLAPTGPVPGPPIGTRVTVIIFIFTIILKEQMGKGM